MSYNLWGGKWGSPVEGTGGGQVTWSFAVSNYTSQAFQFDYQISESLYQELVRDAFQTWESVANIDFVEVSDSANSDIRLGWDYIDGAYNTVGEASYSYFVNSGFDTIDSAEIRFDTSETWSTDMTSLGGVNFYAVALHEIGHAIGLAHTAPGDPASIMAAFTSVDDLTSYDITVIRALYGAATDSHVGTDGPDTFVGGSGDDLFNGAGGDDYLVGGHGNDTLYGGAGHDQIWAGSGDTGDDVMFGDDGNDILGGGAGNDTLVGGTGADVLFGGDGSDLLDTGLREALTADPTSVINVAWAGNGDDVLQGDDATDILGGGTGSDLMRGYGGNDIFYGGRADASASNDDTVYGGDGSDTVYAGVGNDLVFGDNGNDLLFGGDGADTLWGGAGDDRLYGGNGADLFEFGTSSGNDIIYGFSLSAGDSLNLGGQTYIGSVDVHGDLVLALSGGGTITLDGVTALNDDFFA
ncbi:matrixin family metalloprotease [Mesorhizobium sp. B2-5-9]|uniref:matrixin family metalloprotease n=1 Tax=Mesorhizobium sp. B2-5-9 TaxID=2589921 RepID=UPI00112A8A78|nr:matrixin family metalloprotease [Mesorhizobium sp. B2-5-9]TPJ99504.1 matrixin family metalloprotease [Mesorhizobium sp. B2-5-9]